MQLGREVLKSLRLLWAIAPVAHAAQGGLGPASPPQGGPGCSRDALQQPFPRQTLSCLTTPSLPSSGAKWGSLNDFPTFLCLWERGNSSKKQTNKKTTKRTKLKEKKRIKPGKPELPSMGSFEVPLLSHRMSVMGSKKQQGRKSLPLKPLVGDQLNFYPHSQCCSHSLSSDGLRQSTCAAEELQSTTTSFLQRSL